MTKAILLPVLIVCLLSGFGCGNNNTTKGMAAGAAIGAVGGAGAARLGWRDPVAGAAVGGAIGAAAGGLIGNQMDREEAQRDYEYDRDRGRYDRDDDYYDDEEYRRHHRSSRHHRSDY